MKRYLIALIALPGLVFGTDVPESDGKQGCVTKEIEHLLSKTQYRNIEIIKVDLGTLGSDDFEGKGPKGEKYTGFIYTNIWTKGDRIHCQLDRDANLAPFSLFVNMDAFRLTDEDGKTVKRISKLVSVKGKKYGY